VSWKNGGEGAGVAVPLPVAVFQYISDPWPTVRRNKYCAASVALRARGLAMRVSTTHASNCPRRVRPRCGCVRVDAGERMPAVCRRWDAGPYGVGTYWDELPHTQSTTGCPRAWQHRINRLFRRYLRGRCNFPPCFFAVQTHSHQPHPPLPSKRTLVYARAHTRKVGYQRSRIKPRVPMSQGQRSLLHSATPQLLTGGLVQRLL